MRKVLSVSAVLLAFVLVIPAKANDAEYYRHNGSIMEFVWDGEVGEWFEGRYVVPRAGLGVRAGTLLISGSYPANGTVYATVYVFKRGCRPAPYEVEGHFSGDDLYLTGRAPIRERGGCRVIGYVNNNNSSLVFTRIK